MRSMFRGVGVALITPFNEDLSVDFDALEKIVKRCIEGNVDYLVVNGTTAEASTLTTDEKSEVLAFIKKINTTNLPLIYGIGANNTSQVTSLIDTTDFNGIDAILTVSPYYNKPSQEGIYQHYITIAEASPVPVLLYNVPGRTGSNVAADTTIRLSHHPNIFGIKEASGDLNQCLEIMKGKTDDFMLISGDDILTTPITAIGGDGVISVLANAFPADFCKMIHTGLDNDFKLATSLLLPFLPINDLLYKESNPVGVKEVLYNLGICKRHVRQPLLVASEELRQDIKREISILPF